MSKDDFGDEVPDQALFDIQEWPIVFARFPELNEHDRVARTLNGLDRIIGRKTRFVIVWTPASHDHDDEPHQDERASTIWLKHRKRELAEHCAGYIYLTTDPDLRNLLLRRFVDVAKLLPFPKELAENREQALQIARRFLQIAPTGN